MQRGDFLPILIQKFHDKEQINGLIPSMDACSVESRPPSIFECRIKLFKEWSDTWSEAERQQLLNELRSIDEEFVEKFAAQVSGNAKPNEEPLTNGNAESIPGEC